MKVKIKASDLKKLVDGTKRFVSTNDYNKSMKYVHMVNELEERVKDKLVEIVKMYTGEHTNG